MDFLATRFDWPWWFEWSHVPDLSLATWLIIGLALSVVLLFEGAFRFAGQIQNGADTEIRQLETRFAKTTQRRKATANDWNQLAERFKAVRQHDVRAEWSGDEHGSGEWSAIRGPAPDSAMATESCCKLAGALLMASAQIEPKLSPAVRRQPTEWARWLEYIREVSPQRFKTTATGAENVRDTDGTIGQVLTFHGEISNLPLASSDIAVECAGKEWS
jgi:hypothetical protein